MSLLSLLIKPYYRRKPAFIEVVVRIGTFWYTIRGLHVLLQQHAVLRLPVRSPRTLRLPCSSQDCRAGGSGPFGFEPPNYCDNKTKELTIKVSSFVLLVHSILLYQNLLLQSTLLWFRLLLYLYLHAYYCCSAIM